MLEYVADVRLVMMAMERGQKHVDGVKQKASKTKIKVQTDVVLGSISVAKAILHYAEQHNIDLIVIGTRGMSVIKRMLLAGVLLLV
jgi:nucleotide-binding universal stress UspA family protein